MDTKNELAALKALAEKATPGPWDFDTAETPIRIAGGEVVGGDALPYGDVYTVQEYETPEGSESLVVAQEIGADNGSYIAAANPVAILSLISRIEQQAARIAGLEERLARADEVANAGIDAALSYKLDHPTPAVDLSGLTRYMPKVAGGADAFMVEHPNGTYARLIDVQSLLSSPAVREGKMTDNQREKVREAIAEALGEAYDCIRVWSAWSYGTMGPDDFQLVAEDDDRVAEIAEAAISAIEREVLATGKEELVRLREIARLIGSIFVHGDFKAETHNEHELEKLLRAQGTFYESLADYDAGKPATPSTPSQAWEGMSTAPTDGTEILIRYPKQDNAKSLASFNTVHQYWSSKGEPIFPVEQGCEWTHLPADDIRSLSSNPVSLTEKAEAALTIEGHVCDIGQLEGVGSEHGIVIEREAGNVTIKGMTVDEMRQIAPLAFESLTVSFGAASNGNGEKGGDRG